MTEKEEELLGWGLNELHDGGSVHASDLQKVKYGLQNLFDLTLPSFSNMLKCGKNKSTRILQNNSKKRLLI